LLGLTAVLAAQEAPAGNQANVSGKWQMSWQGRNGERQGTLELKQDGSQLTGTMDGSRGQVPVTGSVDGNNITFSIKMSGGKRDFSVTYTGTVDGDKMSGNIQAQGGGGRRGRGGNKGDRTWTATRGAGGPSATPSGM